MAKLTVGQEAYYERQVAAGLDDYFAGRGESPGMWAGSSAAELGLDGVVGDGDLGTLLRGLDPASGERLRTPVRHRTITVERIDPETGRLVEEEKRLAPVSGFDLVFSCPKSVSLLHALTEEESVRRAVSEAHESAWQAALAYLEREACVVRRGHGGSVREHGEGFVAAAFRHRTSRAQDPHLHTHVIVANQARASDGEWRALDGEALLRTYRLAAGYLYEAHLRHELTRTLGVRWREPVKGMGELEGIPEEALRAFSTRRRSLLEHMHARGTDGFEASRVAALATREAKEHVELLRLRQEWLARAAEHGFGRRQLRRVLCPPRPTAGLHLDEVAQRLLVPEGITEKKTTFTMPELVRAVAGAVRDGASVERVLAAADELGRSPLAQLLEPEQAPGHPARFTTRELLEIEREGLAVALAGRNVGAPRTLPSHRLRDPHLALSAEQRRLVREGCLSPDRIVCTVGVAGSGKTSALRLLADSFTEAGVPVLGAAPSGRAADELARATGIRSTTLHRLLLDARQEGGLAHGSVLVIDEAGMAETRVLAPILRIVEEAEGKALLVGDPAQLPAVGAGGLFAALVDHLGAIELGENRHQRHLDEQQALARLRAGKPEEYLALAASRGRLALSDNPLEARSRLLADWRRAAEHDLVGTVMLAHRRADVCELNQAARALLVESGRLGPGRLVVGEQEFRVGERIVCRRNDDRLGVRNGTRGRVVRIDRPHASLTMRTDSGDLRTLPTPYLAAGHAEYAYALTGHLAQGATVERAFVLARDAGALREWGYVACSRARSETRLYLVGDALLERDHHARPLDDRQPTERLAAALERSAAERLALVHGSPAANDDTERLREKLRRDRERALQLAERRLATAQQTLRTLPRLRGRGERAQLEAEISREQAYVRMARNHLAAMPPEPPKRRLESPRRTRALEPPRRPLTRAPERGRDLGLEL
ncbi:MAG: MobF family relaxase [Gaiellaceae bacterium]